MIVIDPSVDLMTFALEYGPLIRKIERSSAGDGLGEAQGRILAALLADTATQAELGHGLCMDSGQVTRATAALKANGLVEASPKSKGRIPLRTTTKGALRAQKILSVRHNTARQVLTSMSDLEKQRLFASVQALGDHLCENGGAFEHHIREAQPGDTGLLTLRAVESFCGSNELAYDSSSLAGYCHGLFASLAAVPHVMLIAMQGRIAGGAIAVSVDQQTKVARIHFLVMFRWWDVGRGTGTELLGQAIKLVRLRGATSIVAELPASDFGPTYYSKLVGWDRTKVEERSFCGRRIQWETWKAALSSDPLKLR